MKRLYHAAWMLGARLESWGRRLAQWGFFHYHPAHPDNPYRERP